MEWSWTRRALRTVARRVWCPSVVLGGAMALAGCNTDGQPDMSAAQPRGATVAFESIDGLPPGQFRTLVQSLNDEAQSRRLAVMSRENPSAYRVRGYLAAKVLKGRTTISWVWDVFDGDEHRAFRISGEETAKVRHRDAWAAADSAMLQRIARSSIDELAGFLTSPEVVPASPSQAQVAEIGVRESSPEAAGIFRIFHANADPASTETAETAEAPTAANKNAGPVPLPRRRPSTDVAVSALDPLTLAASNH